MKTEKNIRIVGAFGYKEDLNRYNGLSDGEFLGNIKTNLNKEDLIKALHKETDNKYKIIQICEIGKPNFKGGLNF